MKRNGILQPLVLSVVLATGFLGVCLVLGWWALEFVVPIAWPASRVEVLQFLADGTPLLVNFSTHHDRAEEYRDLEGNVVTVDCGPSGFVNPTSLPVDLPDGRHAGDVPWGARICSFADGRTPPVYWYFVADGRADGTACFVGYHSLSKECVGYLGTAGFREGPVPPEERIPFGGAVWGSESRVFCTQQQNSPAKHPRRSSAGRAPRGSLSEWDVYVLGLDGKIYHADLHNRTLAVALDGPRVRSAAVVTGLTDPVHGTPHHLAARTEDAILVFDEQGGLLNRYPVPEALRGLEIEFAETSTGVALMDAHRPRSFLDPEVEHRICWVAKDGPIREARLTLSQRLPSMEAAQLFGFVVVPAPLVLDGLVGIWLAQELCDKGLAATYPEAAGRALTEFAPALVIAQLLAAVLAVLCWRRQVRYGASGRERIVWPLFVLLLGLPGWVGYRFGRSWPVLEVCPRCGVRVPRDREACARCEAHFSPPALKGTEVFA